MDKIIHTSTFIHKMRLLFISFLIFISAISNIASATFSVVIIEDIEDFTDPNSPVKSITAIEKDERIFVKIHLYTIPDEVSEGVEKMRFQVSVKDKYLLYEFCSEKRVDQVISFSFPKCDLEKISGRIEMLHTKEELSDAVTYYFFSIEDFLKKSNKPDEESKDVEKMQFHVSAKDEYLLYEFCSKDAVICSIFSIGNFLKKSNK